MLCVFFFGGGGFHRQLTRSVLVPHHPDRNNMPRGGKWGIFYKSLWLKDFRVWEEPKVRSQKTQSLKNSQGTFDQSGACSGDQVILMSCIGGCTKKTYKAHYPILAFVFTCRCCRRRFVVLSCSCASIGPFLFLWFLVLLSIISILPVLLYHLLLSLLLSFVLAFAVVHHHFSWCPCRNVALLRQSGTWAKKCMASNSRKTAAGPWRDTMWCWLLGQGSKRGNL